MAFYTYMWLREDGTPYYVGYGQKRRAFLFDGRQPARAAFGMPPRDRIIIQEWDTKADAKLAEEMLILCYGRQNNSTGPLLNQTDGGRTLPAEIRQKMSNAGRGRPKSEEWKRKMSLIQKGRKVSPKLREVMDSPEYKAKQAARMMGNQLAKGATRSVEFRQHVSEVMKGNKYAAGLAVPPEVRQKISEAMKKYRARIRGKVA